MAAKDKGKQRSAMVIERSCSCSCGVVKNFGSHEGSEAEKQFRPRLLNTNAIIALFLGLFLL